MRRGFWPPALPPRASRVSINDRGERGPGTTVSQRSSCAPATTFDWDTGRFPLNITKGGGRYSANLTPRDLVDAGIWTGAAIHVDSATGDGANTGQKLAAEILFRGELVIEGSLGNGGGFYHIVQPHTGKHQSRDKGASGGKKMISGRIGSS